MRVRPFVTIVSLLLGTEFVANTPVHAQTHPTATVLQRSIDAYDAIARDGRLYVLEPDQRALAAYALPSLSLAWRTPLPDATTSASQLTALEPGRLLIWNDGRLYVITRATGAIAARQSVPAMRQRPFLDQHGDACGLNRECTFQPIECSDAHLLGAPLTGARMEFFDDQGASSGCYGFDRHVVGATPAASVFVFSGTEGSHTAFVMGVGRSRGNELYRSERAACRQCSPTGLGAAPALDLCWTSDMRSGIDVRAFTCSTGALRWSWHRAGTPPNDVVTSVLTTGAAPTLLASTHGASILLDARTGAVRWTRSLPPDVLGVISGARSDASLVHIYGFTGIATLDAATGAVLSTTSVPHGRVAWQPDGTFRVVDFEVPGETGGPSAPMPPSDPVFRVDRGPGETGAQVRLRSGNTLIVTLPHDGWWVGEAQDGGGVLGVVFEHAPRSTGRVRFVRASGP